jgi:2-polyprenyl-3-methyl-5-hydroxy-6-metoxy-1,4-benzoquinol methylase
MMSEFTRIEIIYVACPLCSDPNASVLFEKLEDVEDRVPGFYSISECNNCSLVYLSRRPTEDSLPLCYSTNYHVVDDARRHFIADFLYSLRLKLRYSALLKACGIKWTTLLEIGCGDGSFLSWMHRNRPASCSFVGIDYLVPPLASPDPRLSLLQGEFEKVEFNIDFEVVVMFNVLEHVADPLKVLKRISEIMSPSGILFGEVPNWLSPWRRLFPRHWQGLQIPRHQTHFDPHTLRKLLEVAGYKNIILRPVYDPGDLAVTFCNWVSEALRLKTPPRRAWFYMPVVLLSAPLVWLANLLGGDSGSIGFTAQNGGGNLVVENTHP